jgi:hypothetical protein
MKKVFKLLGIIALVTVIGFSFVACSAGTGGGGGGGGSSPGNNPDSGKSGTLTITNFQGSPGLTENNYVAGATFYLNYLGNGFAFAGKDWSQMDSKAPAPNGTDLWGQAKITGSTITLEVFMHASGKVYLPTTGSKTVKEGDLTLYENHPDKKIPPGNVDYAYIEYRNVVPITFTNGNATINFGTQMYLYHSSPGMTP